MRILFMGTPDFAKTALLAINEKYTGQIVGVVTRQDTPKNRGHVMTPPPVKVAALGARREEVKRELPDAGDRMRHYEKELEEWKD